MRPDEIGSYDPLLVGLSAVVALASSFASLDLATKGRFAELNRTRWTIAAALTFGTGVWVTHYVAMLAFLTPVTVEFDIGLTLASLAVAVGLAAAGFSLSARGIAGRWSVPLAGFVTGSGISAMHYLGIASMEMPARIAFDYPLVALSVACALSAASVAHWVSFQPPSRAERHFAAFIICFAVVGLHYVGMAATEFTVLGRHNTLPGRTLGHPAIAVPAAFGAAGFLLWFLLTFVLERIRFSKTSASQEARHSAIVDTAVDSIVVIDEAGTIISMNPAAERTFGYPGDEAIGQNVKILMPEPHRSAHDGYLQHYYRTGERRIIGIGRRTEAQRRDGSTFPIDLAVAEWFADGKRYFTGMVRDETHRWEAEQALRASERRQAIAIDASGGGIYEHSVPPGTELYLSPRWCEIMALGETPITAEGYLQWFSDLIHPDDRALHERTMAAFVQGEESRFQIEMRLRHGSGNWIWVRQYAQAIERNEDGIALRLSGLMVDITERKKSERWIKQLAHHDPLTGLANRTLFTEKLGAALREAETSGRKVALVHVDLDGFKNVNDTLGHSVGDGLLTVVTERLLRSLRRGDTAARLGGDEFAVILADLRSTDDIQELTRRICHTVVQPAVVNGHTIEFLASLGVALYPEDGGDLDLLMRHADLALYESKANPLEHVAYFHPGLAEAAARRAAIETELRGAVRRDELLLHFQPQFNLQTGRVRTVEALVRWRRADRIVFPGEFIDIAETSGVIRALGAWVLGAACQQQAVWRAEGHEIGVAVNVSPAEANTFEITRTVDAALAMAGIPGETLELEITEGLLMDPDAPPVRAFLAACKARRIGLAIDDFGKGYSSLGYLARLPISKIKIDRSFVSKIGRRADEALIEAIVDLGHRLGHRVVAEGVETTDQLDYLRDLGCDDAQGHLLGRPVTAEALKPVLQGGWLI